MDENGRIVFEGEESAPARQVYAQPSRMVQLAMVYSGGLIKTENQANWVFVVFISLALLFSGFLLFKGESTRKLVAPPGYRVVSPPHAPPYIEKIK